MVISVFVALYILSDNSYQKCNCKLIKTQVKCRKFLLSRLYLCFFRVYNLYKHSPKKTTFKKKQF